MPKLIKGQTMTYAGILIALVIIISVAIIKLITRTGNSFPGKISMEVDNAKTMNELRLTLKRWNEKSSKYPSKVQADIQKRFRSKMNTLSDSEVASASIILNSNPWVKD